MSTPVDDRRISGSLQKNQAFQRDAFVPSSEAAALRKSESDQSVDLLGGRKLGLGCGRVSRPGGERAVAVVAAMDWCVEPEIAHDEDAILDRISGTVRLNIQCLNGADRRGIADRFVPVTQGSHPEHYLRCLERMPFALDFPLVGIGSMCRRHVEGEYGILHVLDVLDRAFNGSETRFHLFGLKSQGMSAARTHNTYPGNETIS